ncbi:fasciclin domain-containing protein [Sphingomonas sp. KR1UV-12]|uniref:Fasciclin domain-containing protein n=1 Tax=Sphingomonas aurea TaxID=3063994 RepID=A0ABT9EI15_9SPHN|nr:fasciclin domain-containing protein [Sphingomonas sp. KR1UV-12]MDP1026604.1 fasciclin domain-containing protein [Sphingomonas sp. KR1UV-12]
MRSTVFLTPALLAATLVAVPAAAQTGAPTTQTPAANSGVVPPGAPGTAAPAIGTPPAPATTTPAASTTIAAAIAASPDHKTLQRLIVAAKLEPTLSGPGPYTVFAPKDSAFALLPAGTLDTLLAPANVASLTTILKNHVVAGAMTSDQLRAAITSGGGKATLATLSGQSITASLEGQAILLTDAVGNKSYIDKPDLKQSNGVIHSTNGISLPKLG